MSTGWRFLGIAAISLAGLTGFGCGSDEIDATASADEALAQRGRVKLGWSASPEGLSTQLYAILAAAEADVTLGIMRVGPSYDLADDEHTLVHLKPETVRRTASFETYSYLTCEKIGVSRACMLTGLQSDGSLASAPGPNGLAAKLSRAMILVRGVASIEAPEGRMYCASTTTVTECRFEAR